jgi:hypothetical protein
MHFNTIFPPMPSSSKCSLRISPPKPSMHFSSTVLWMTHPSHPSWYNDPNNIRWRLQIMKHLIIQFTPVSCYFLPLRPFLTSSAPYSQTQSAYIPPLVLETLTSSTNKYNLINTKWPYL